MNILGIDYSMSSPGFCMNKKNFMFVTSNKKMQDFYCELPNGMTLESQYYNHKESGHTEIYRFCGISNAAFKWINKFDKGHAYIEGYAYGARGRLVEIAENTGIFKAMLLMNGWTLEVVAPGTAKKGFAGNGKAKKDEMADAFNKKYGFYLHDYLGLDSSLKSPAADLVDSIAMIEQASYKTY